MSKKKSTQKKNTQPKNTQPKNTQPKNTQPKNTQPKNTQPKNTQSKKIQPEKTSGGNGFILRLTLTLVVITAITSLLLGLVNSATKDRIAALAEETRQEAMHSVIVADEYRPTEQSGGMVAGVTEAYSAGTLAGYCVDVTTTGFAGDIDMMVGVDTNCAVVGVVILAQNETPGLGTKTAEPDFLNQYTGRTDTITVNTGDNAIDAITGATISSKAVTKGVNAALEAIQTISEGGSINVG